MEEPTSFYQGEKERTISMVSRLKKRSFSFAMIRLFVFLSIPTCIYFFLNNVTLLGIVLALLIVIFLYLVKKSAVLSEQSFYYKNKLEIINNELNGLRGDFSAQNVGDEYALSGHDFAHDMDIFRDRGIFQMLNRTSTKEGEKYLADILNKNDIENVREKQEALAELSNKVADRLHFHAQAKSIEEEVSPNQLIQYFKEYKSFIPSFWKYAVPLLILVSISVIGATILNIIPSSYLLYWFLFGLGITGIYFKKVTKVQQKLDKARYILLNYRKLIEHLETQEFKSELLKNHHAVFVNSKHKFSLALNKLYSALNALDQRQNGVFALIGAGFLFWDLQQMLKIEKWIKEQTKNVEGLFEEIAFFDAYYALAHYNFLNPTYTLPEINSEGEFIVSEIIHPLMPQESAVANSYSINSGEFFIVTGANMAGKSTFLRTVGTSLILANIGLNVRAKSYNYTPIKVVSSMRTEDSLQDNASYFFSELQRLKFINDRLDEEPCFVILDEILKGTNSKDKAEGSRNYIATLFQLKATGIIATHDLSLCELSKEYSAINNYFFEAQIKEDELYFDYLFKKGICQNMNASFLLRKMKIVRDI